MSIKTESGFEIETQSGKFFTARKILFATGVKDIFPEIKGFDECWGISVLHCPYCHGYEVKKEKTAIIANGEMGFELCKTDFELDKRFEIVHQRKINFDFRTN